jgi:hypothetical protein
METAGLTINCKLSVCDKIGQTILMLGLVVWSAWVFMHGGKEKENRDGGLAPGVGVVLFWRGGWVGR